MTARLIAVLLCAGVLGAMPSCAQTITSVDRDKFRDITMPFDASHVVHFFGPSAPPTGETIQFSLRGPVILNVVRRPTELRQGGSVTLRLQEVGGAELAAVSDSVSSFQDLYLRRIAAPMDRETLLTVTVVDDARGGPTGGGTYGMLAEAWPVSSGGEVRLAQGTEPARPTAKCELNAASAPLSQFVEGIDTISRAAGPSEQLVVKAYSAGSRLMVTIPPGWSTPAQPARISVRAKHVGDGPFMPVCDGLAVPASDREALFHATAPVSDESIWRIEVVAPGRAAQQSVAPLRVSRTRVLALPPTISHSDAWRHGLAHVCFDRVPNQIVETPVSGKFGGRPVLKVDFAADPGALAPALREELVQTVVQAVYLWVRACVICRLDNLAVVQIDGRTFVHPGLYGSFGIPLGMSRGGPTPVPSPDKVNEFLRDGLATGRAGFPMQTRPYRELHLPLATEFAPVCASPSDAEHQRTLHAIKRAVCGAARAEESAITLRFTDRGTYCGSGDNIIACRADAQLTEFNTAHFRFRLGGAEASVIGRGAVEVDFLHTLMHEMGHWIGLHHVDEGESLMASSMEQSRCVDARTMEALAQNLLAAEPDKAQPEAFVYRRQRSTHPRRSP